MPEIQTVRLLVGDTETTQQIEDVSYAFFLTENGNNIYLAAADAALAIAAKYARRVNRSGGPDQVLSDSHLYEHYKGLSAQLRSRAVGATANSTFTALPFAGGIRVGAKETNEANTDRVAPAFTKTLQEAV